MARLSVVVPVDVFRVHGLSAGVDDAGEVDGAPGLDEQLLSAQDGSAGFWKKKRERMRKNVKQVFIRKIEDPSAIGDRLLPSKGFKS